MTGAYHFARTAAIRGACSTWAVRRDFFVFDPLDRADHVHASRCGLWRSTDSGRDVEPVVSITCRYCRCRDAVGSRRRADPDESRALSTCRRAGHRSCRLQSPLRGSGREGNAIDTSRSPLDGGQELEGERRICLRQFSRLYIDPASPAGDRTITAVTANVPDGSLGRRIGKSTRHRRSSSIFPRDTRRPTGHLRLYGVSRDSLHISDDGGGTWRSSEIQPGAKPRLSAIATSAQHTEVAYAAFGNLGRPALSVSPRPPTAGAALDDGVEGNVRPSPLPILHDGWISERLRSQAGESTPLSLGPLRPPIRISSTPPISGGPCVPPTAASNWSGVYSSEGIGRRRYHDREWMSLQRTASTSTRSTPSACSSPTRTSDLFRSEDGGVSWIEFHRWRSASRGGTRRTGWTSIRQCKGRMWSGERAVRTICRDQKCGGMTPGSEL